MSDVTVWSDFDNMLINIIRDALDELGLLIRDKVVASIDKNVYIGRNQTYKTTYEFRESWEYQLLGAGRNAEVLIKSNPDKMTVDTSPNVNRHGSNIPKNSPPNDIREALPEILAFGLSGGAFGSGWWVDGRGNYLNDVLDDLHSNGWLNKTFKRLLRQRGLTVV